VRGFKANTADLLCIAATGGYLSTRQLCTDDTEHTQRLHVAVVLNGIHAFLNQPDLAQRCLPIRLRSLEAGEHKSETDLAEQFEADLPSIMKGLFDRIAAILQHLPYAEVTSPERMIDYSRWLAAMELADGVPPGTYQSAYSYIIAKTQLDTLLDNPLVAAILDFAASIGKATSQYAPKPSGDTSNHWNGTPRQLYELLEDQVPVATMRSRYWPSNAIAMSKRLLPLQAGLREQGVHVKLTRGETRLISITRLEGFGDD
jgi:hypothetical protein